MKPEHFYSRAYSILTSPVLLAAGIVLTFLPLLCLPDMLALALPGCCLLIAWGLAAAHRPPEGSWRPHHITIEDLANCNSLAIGTELLLNGNCCIGSVAAPVELTRTLSMRSQSSSFLLASAAALTCNRHGDAAVSAAIRQALTRMGIEPEKMMSRWRLLSNDAPAHTWGVTVQDGTAQRCFFLGDPLTLILTCRRMMTGAERRIEADDRTALLQTLESMQKDGASIIGYAMIDSPDRSLECATFLGMLSLETEAYPHAAATLESLAPHFYLFADLPACNLDSQAKQLLLPTARCSERAVAITLGRRRGPTLQLQEGCQAATGWEDAILAWRHFARRVRYSAFVALMLLPAALLWLLVAVFQFTHPALALPLLFPAAVVCATPCQRYPNLPKAWLVWPAVTAAGALLLTLPALITGVSEPLAPGVLFALGAVCAFSTLPCAFAPEATQRKAFAITCAIALAVMLPTWLLLCAGSTYSIVIAVLGVVWGVISRIGLIMHIHKHE